MTMQHWTKEDFLTVLKEVQVVHLQPEIQRIVKEALEAERASFWVPSERHYNEHVLLEKCVRSATEKEKNHEFVSSMRQRGQMAFNIGFGLAVVAICGGLATIFSEGFRHWFWSLFLPKSQG